MLRLVLLWVILLLAFLFLMVGVARASEHAHGLDHLELREGPSDNIPAEIIYLNHGWGISVPARGRKLSLGDISVSCDIDINVNEEKHEGLYCEEESGEYVVVPPEGTVADGETLILQIMRPMF